MNENGEMDITTWLVLNTRIIWLVTTVILFILQALSYFIELSTTQLIGWIESSWYIFICCQCIQFLAIRYILCYIILYSSKYPINIPIFRTESGLAFWVCTCSNVYLLKHRNIHTMTMLDVLLLDTLYSHNHMSFK